MKTKLQNRFGVIFKVFLKNCPSIFQKGFHHIFLPGNFAKFFRVDPLQNLQDIFRRLLFCCMDAKL